MNMKKMISAIAACALSAAALAATASAGDPIGNAYFIGQLGADQVWNLEDAADAIAIDGDAQYECEWNLTGGGTGTVEFLCLTIKGTGDGFTTDQFPDLAVTLDEVWIDGVQVADYTVADPSKAYNTAYYDGGVGYTRIYLHDEWAGTGVADLPKETTITSNIKVLFTVSGTGITGTSNVEGATPEQTDAPAEDGDNTATTTTTASGGSNTGDAGIALAVAGLAVAGAAAYVARKKN